MHKCFIYNNFVVLPEFISKIILSLFTTYIDNIFSLLNN